MLNRKMRHDVEGLQAQLLRWAVEVPPRAARFHDLRLDLERQISDFAGRLLLRRGDTELATLRSQIERVDALVEPLNVLLRRAEEAEQEVVSLRSGAEESADRELASWLVDRCVDWQSTLRRLGSNVGRLVELDQDRPVLERTQERVRRHAEVRRLLDEARGHLTRLGDKLEAAALRADLPRLRQRLFEQGGDVAWLAEMERTVAPLRLVVDLPPPKPPRDLEEIRRRLAEARRWGRALKSGEARTSGLQEDAQLAEAEWGRGEGKSIDNLLGEVSALLEELRREAADRRAAALAGLGRRCRLLAAACGPSTDLDRELDQLSRAEAVAPEDYEPWMDRWAEVDRHLAAAAGSRLIDVQEWIDRQYRGLAEALALLEGAPLSDRGASEAERLRLDLGSLPDPYALAGEEIFSSLESCDRMRLALEEQSARARGEREALAAIRRDLLRQNGALREQVEVAEFELPDLTARIEDLASADPGGSLDTLNREAAALRGELLALQSQVVALCRGKIAERLPALIGRSEILSRLGLQSTPLPAPLGEETLPEVAVRTLVELRQREQELDGQLRETRLRLGTETGERLAELRELLQRSLRVEVRRDADELVCELEELSKEGEDDLEAQVRHLADTLSRCEILLTKLSQEEREARVRAEELRRHLVQFNELDLDHFAPAELVRRASALVAAIPSEPPSWSPYLAQLDVAADFLGRLESHALRVKAARLERAIPDLRRQSQETRDPAYARRLKALLADVAEHDEGEALPGILSAQVLMLTSETGLEGRV